MKSCTVTGCEKPHKSKGLCGGHYQRRKRGLPLDAPLGTKSSREGTCTGPECSDPVLAAGLCSAHYEQQRSGKPLTVKRQYVEREGSCDASGCERDRLSEGLCQTHYRRRLRGEADWDRPILEKAADGEGHVNEDGYRIVQCPRTRRPRGQHIVFAERLLNRPLARNPVTGRAVENVHHVNGDRLDNSTDGPFVLDERGRLRSGNLEVWSTAQPAGQEIGPKIDWATDLLRLYAPHLLTREETVEEVAEGLVSPDDYRRRLAESVDDLTK